MSIRNKTQKEVANQIGITPVHFSRLMKNECEPSADTRKKLLKAFAGVSWDRLFKIHEGTNGTGTI